MRVPPSLKERFIPCLWTIDLRLGGKMVGPLCLHGFIQKLLTLAYERLRHIRLCFVLAHQAFQAGISILLPFLTRNLHFESCPPMWISYLLMFEAIAERKTRNFYLFLAMHLIFSILIPH